MPPIEASEDTVSLYRITVRGRLTDWFAGAFYGMNLETGTDETTLAGPVTDQSHLFGILDRIRSLGIDLISVEPGNPRC
jgi:hypothetical protein